MQEKTQHNLGDWKFSFSEGGLSPTAEIEQIAELNKLFRPPTIIFAKNTCEIAYEKSNFRLLYDARRALKFINYEERKKHFYKTDQEPIPNGITYIPDRLQIKHAEKWKSIGLTKDIEITEVEETSDSFFVTPFKGHCEGDFYVERVNESVIPVHKLGPHNEIKFYKQGSIYEDQLDDNGLIQYEYKFRAMADSWFGLIRCYVRVDDVIIIILDTRIYWEAGWSKIARQFMVKESTWADLKAKGFEPVGGWSTNPHQSHLVYELLTEKFVENEYIHLSTKQEGVSE